MSGIQSLLVSIVLVSSIMVAAFVSGNSIDVGTGLDIVSGQ